MVRVWLAVLLFLVPGIAAGQVGIVPTDPRGAPVVVPPPLPPGLIYETPPGTLPIEIAPDTPPPPTVPAGPRVLVPTPTPTGVPPRRLLEFRPRNGGRE